MHRIITLGLHHDHVWSNLEELAATGRAELAGAADADAELLAKYRDRFPGETTESYDELLSRDGLTADGLSHESVMALLTPGDDA